MTRRDPFDEALADSRAAAPLPEYRPPRSWPTPDGETHDVKLRALLVRIGARLPEPPAPLMDVLVPFGKAGAR